MALYILIEEASIESSVKYIVTHILAVVETHCFFDKIVELFFERFDFLEFRSVFCVLSLEDEVHEIGKHLFFILEVVGK